MNMDETKLYSWFLGPKAENADMLERLFPLRAALQLQNMNKASCSFVFNDVDKTTARARVN